MMKICKENMKTWKLWLDDDLLNDDCPNRRCPNGYIGFASSEEAIAFSKVNGPPVFMDLDHDLGGDDTSMVYLKWLYDNYPNMIIDYHVHSENVVGKANIISYMESWKKSLR
jgi:hypothetical protein